MTIEINQAAEVLLKSLGRSIASERSDLGDVMIDPWMDVPWSWSHAQKLLVADAMEALADYALVMEAGQARFGAELAAEGRVPFAQQWQRAELERQLTEMGEEF